ncbi:hypothetical protein [Rhodanobacter hydrolyticus]|uniref:hypothetical protein n=1 Tax=Rhodanobacter hydrolyticus TaxID=2250595 RepID=UPI00384D4B6A
MKLRLPFSIGHLLSWSCTTAAFLLAITIVACREPAPQEKIFILTLLLCSAGTLLFAFARPATAVLVSSSLLLLLKFVSATKLRYLESPLMPADFVYFAHTSLVETLEHYPHLLRLGVAACVLAPLLLVLVWNTDHRLFPSLRGGQQAGVRAAGATACVLAFWICLLPHGPFKAIYDKGLWSKLSDRAYLTNFFITIHDSTICMPAMASTAEAEQGWAATAVPDAITDGPHQSPP